MHDYPIYIINSNIKYVSMEPSKIICYEIMAISRIFELLAALYPPIFFYIATIEKSEQHQKCLWG